MARRGGPALYELLDSKRGAAVPAGGLARPKLDPRTLQSLVFVAIALVLIVVAYLVGVSRGERLGRMAAEGGGPNGVAAVAAPPAQPGQASGARNGSGNQSDGLTPENPAVAGAGETLARAPGAVVAAALGPASAGDPRQIGLQYFVLCSTLEPNAIKVVEFCRSKGLDAYVVPDQNGRLREVTVLPGFASGERSSPAIKDLEERIRKVGVLFKASGPGNSDFGDRYIKTHRERQ